MTVAPRTARASGALPLVGHLLPLLRDPLRFLGSLPDQGDLVRVRFGPFAAVVVCDPQLTRQVLRNDRVFDKTGPAFGRIRELVGDGLGICPHSQHRRQRRLIQPVFHPAQLPDYARTMTAQIATETSGWRDGDVLQVFTETQVLAARILVSTMFTEPLPPAVLRQALDDLNILATSIYLRTVLPILGRLPTPGNRRYRQARARLYRTLGKIIDDRRRGDTDPGDLLSVLLTAPDPAAEGSGRQLSDKAITDEIVMFFGAGADTTASALAWALHLVALHPDIERRLHAEVDAVLAGAPATFDKLPQLELTGRIVTEALRLYPPVWLVARTATEDTTIGEHAIRAGTNVFYSSYVIHRRPDLYPDPDRFDPDRWTSENDRQPGREAFIPFADGARKCIGDRFAMVEATLALATIATRWRLHHLPGPTVRPTLAIPMKPRELRMRLEARTVTPA